MPEITRAHIESLGPFRTEVDGFLDNCVLDLYPAQKEDATKAVNKILRAFFTPAGLPVAAPRQATVRRASKDTSLTEEQLDNVFSQLVEKNILRNVAKDNFTLADNNLAAVVFSRLDLELQILREARTRFDRHYANYKDTGALMSEEEYASVSQYLDALALTVDQQAFAEKSHQEIRKKSRRRFVVLSTVLSVIVSLLLIVVYLQLEKNRTTRALNDTLTLQTEELQTLNNALEIAVDSLNKQQLTLDMTIAELTRNKAELEAANGQLRVQRDSISTLYAANRQLLDSTVSQNKILTDQRNEIEKQRSELELLNKQLAERNKELAEVNNTLERLQGIAITRNVANEAVKLDINNSDFKAALALEAYNFNKKVEGGDVLYPGIYSALYYGARDMHGASPFNIGYEQSDRPIQQIVRLKEQGSIVVVGAGGEMACHDETGWNIDLGPTNVDPGSDGSAVPVHSIHASGDEVLVTYFDGTVRAFSQSCPLAERWHVSSLVNPNTRFAIQIDQQRVALVDEHTVMVYDRQNKTGIRRDSISRSPETTTIECADLADGSEVLILGMSNGQVAVYNTASGKFEFLGVLDKPITAINYFDLRVKGRLRAHLATGYADGSFQIWHVSDPGSLEVKAEHRESPASGFRILNSSNTHNGRISDIRLSPLGNYLAISSYDGTTSIWSTRSIISERNPVYLPIVLDDHESWVKQAMFSPDEMMVATVEANGTVKAFHLDPEYYALEICKHGPAPISDDDWQRYFGEKTKIQQQGCSNDD